MAAALAGAGGVGILTGPLAKARFWVLRPTWVRLVDNTVRFGFKEEWRVERCRGSELGRLRWASSVHEGKLLVFEGQSYHPLEDPYFYRPLGGGIEFGEYGAQAIVREMREEIGAEITNVRYLGLSENIFTHIGERGHEIVLLFEAEFVDRSFYERDDLIVTEAPPTTFRALWKPLADFADGRMPLYPYGLVRILTQHGHHA